MSIYAFGFLSRQFYLILCLTKCNTKLYFFVLFYFFISVCYLLKEKNDLKQKCTESINPRISKTSNGRIMFVLKCAVCSIEKSRFIKEQKASKLLSQLGIRTPLSKISLLGDILFW